MRNCSQSAQRPKTCIIEKQEDVECYGDVFKGIKTGVAIAFIVFWIPVIVSYLILGWWFVITYCITLVVATVMAGFFIRGSSEVNSLLSKASYR